MGVMIITYCMSIPYILYVHYYILYVNTIHTICPLLDTICQYHAYYMSIITYYMSIPYILYVHYYILYVNTVRIKLVLSCMCFRSCLFTLVVLFISAKSLYKILCIRS